MQALAGAMLRRQLLPAIVIDFSIGCCTLLSRTSGGLTGSRTAGAMGRVPVEAALQDSRERICSFGFECGVQSPLISCTYVDNLYFFSHSVGGALKMAAIVQSELKRTWGLTFKPGSAECMPVAGAAEWDCVDELADAWPQWTFVDRCAVLGMLISNSGSVAADMEACRRGVWGSYVHSCSSAAATKLPLGLKLRLLDRAGRAAVDFRSSRWPTTPTAARLLDSLQRRCLILAQRLPRNCDETMESWCYRRSRAAGALARDRGLWSTRHVQRARAWRDHLLRERNHDSPASILFRFHGAQWRAQRRLAAGSARTAAGRLRSRVLPHVHARWEDSVAE